MKINRPTWEILSLLLVGIASFILWRIELFNNGWPGLTWITYFHYAIVYGFLIFLLWANVISINKIKLHKLLYLNGAGLILAFLYYNTLCQVYYSQHISGPTVMITMYSPPSWLRFLGPYPDQTIMLLFITLTFLLLRLFKLQINLWYILAAIIISLSSIPLSVFLMQFMDFIGEPDHRHMIKTGLFIPFVLIPIGLVIAGIKTQHQPKELRPRTG